LYSFFNLWERGCINVHNQEIEKERKKEKTSEEIVERDASE